MTSVWRIGYCENPVPSHRRILASLGVGSTLANGRWHVKGSHQVVYCSASRALCQLEKRVHANGANPARQALMRLDLPHEATLWDVEDIGLPGHWRSDEGVTQSIGMSWASAGEGLGMWVPSFVEPGDRNLILNPAHPDYQKIQITIERNPFKFDPRLF